MHSMCKALFAIALLVELCYLGAIAKESPNCLDEGDCRSMKSVFKQQTKRGETLDEFLKSTVEPTQAEAESKLHMVDKIVGALQQRFKTQKPFTSAEIFKAGSLGKGTAVRESSDVELILFLNGLPKIEDLVKELPKLLNIIEEVVQAHTESRIIQVIKTQNSVSFLSGDVQVAVRPASEDVNKSDLRKIYEDMAKYKGGLQQAAVDFSSTLAKRQVEFVKQAPGYLKGVMRLLKYWAKENKLSIFATSLELLAIHVSRAHPELKSTNDLLRESLRLLADVDNVQIAFGENYQTQDYTRNLRGPYILDPANPYVDTLFGIDLKSVKRVATKTCTTCARGEL